MSLSTKEIKEILKVLEASGWDEATVTVGEVTVTVFTPGVDGVGASSNPKSFQVLDPASAGFQPAPDLRIVNFPDPDGHMLGIEGR